MIRTTDRTAPPRSRSRTCVADGCERTTREGKPYCLDHVERHGYVAELQGKLRNREAEEERARRGKAPGMDSLLVHEVLHHVRVRGEATTRRLAADMKSDRQAVLTVVRELARRGHVATRRRKSDLVVRLA